MSDRERAAIEAAFAYAGIPRDIHTEFDPDHMAKLRRAIAAYNAALQERICDCGHTAHWHGDSGRGSCEHDGECRCRAFEPLHPAELCGDCSRSYADHDAEGRCPDPAPEHTTERGDGTPDLAERVVPQDEGSTIGIKESNDAIAISIPEHGERLIEATIGPCTVEEAENAAEIVQEALDGQAPSLDAVVCCELAPDFPPVPQDDPERSVSESSASGDRPICGGGTDQTGADVPLSAENDARCWCGATERHHQPGHPMHPFREATGDELAELSEAERGPPICASCGCSCGCDPARLSATAPEREINEHALFAALHEYRRCSEDQARGIIGEYLKALSSPSEPK